jgi:hypothetical protein
LTVPSIGSITQTGTPGSATAEPPSLSPSTRSAGRSTASRVRSSRSVSLSTTVTGSVGLLLVCTASAAVPAPNTSARRAVTKPAALRGELLGHRA